MNYKLLSRLIFFMLLTGGSAYSQQTEAHYDPEKQFRLGYELFTKEKYSAARETFSKFIEQPGNSSLNKIMDAEYYSALSGAELFHPDAETELIRFTEKYPESLKTRTAYFNAALILYRQKKYKPAIQYFEKTDISYLSNEEIAEYYFKSGYSYFMVKDLTRASKNFHEILKTESKYKTAANYYFAHVAYQNNNYSTALEAFEKLKDSESFAPVVPFYIVQIYYEQQKYDDVIKYAQTLEGRTDIKNMPEINRYVAESYYKNGKYDKALLMFQDFERNYPRLSREDYYQLGYSYYKTGNCEKAVTYFEKVVNVKDKLQQVAYYNLADCFLKNNNKQSARNAFQFASKQDFNQNIKEESLFNYAKLSFELSYQPVAINSLNEFMKLYPESVHKDEANEILAQLYITTRNYKDALISLDKIRTKSEKANLAYQKVAFFRGIEYFNDRDYEKAIGLFNKAITTEIDQSIRSKAMYWKAEALYNQGQYEAAIKQYRIFVFNPPSVNEANYNTGNYNIGYCYFKLENFPEANTWFRKFLKSENQDQLRINDAAIRTGDAFFMMKNYESALDFYNQAVANNAKASDYCLFQNGMIQGIQGNTQGKIKTMDQLAARYSKSAYLDDALYEKGTAMMSTENFTGAEEIFRRVIRESPNSEYAKKSLLKIALLQYNQKQDEKALATYKDVVKKYPSTPEAAEALTGIRNIYVSSGNPQAYFDYVKNVSAFSVSTGAQDSITYEAAEQLYLKGDHKNASANFKNYLDKFPNGYFVLNASFYKAESDYRNKDYNSALTGYNFVIGKPRNIFTEKSLLKAATILFSDKKYDEALVNYIKLEEAADFRDNVIEAQAGQMRCHFKKGNFDDCITFARKLIEGEKVSNELITEAHLLLARSSMATNDLQTATTEFTIVTKTIPNSDAGAESKYQLALIQNMLGNYKESQKKCFEVINQVPSYDFWIGKSFILLGDNYVTLKDEFQAKHTYKSIIDNYEKSPSDPEDLRVIAQEKLNALENKETEKSEQEIKEKEEKYELMQQDSTGLENN